MIETERLVREMLSIMWYAEKTLKLHPEKGELVQKHLASEATRLTRVVKAREREDDLDILLRTVVF